MGCDTQSASHGFTSLSVFVEKNLLSNNWKVDWFDPFCNEKSDVLKSYEHKNLQRKAVIEKKQRMMTPGPLCHRCAPTPTYLPAGVSGTSKYTAKSLG